jgi:hypothetical protein
MFQPDRWRDQSEARLRNRTVTFVDSVVEVWSLCPGTSWLSDEPEKRLRN